MSLNIQVMAKCNPTKFPMDPKEHLTKDEGGKVVDSTRFKRMVGGVALSCAYSI